MRTNRVAAIALLVSLVYSTAFATPVTYESAPVSADTGVSAPYEQPGESDDSVLFDLSGAPLMWVSTPIYLRLPIFGAGAFGSDDESGPGLAWVPGSGSGNEGAPSSEVPPVIGPGDDTPGNDGPGDDQPGDDLPCGDCPRDQPPVDDVPEPATLLLLSPAVMLLVRRRRQSRA
jgi:hypothetical protein